MDLVGKISLVTGAGQGIGEGIAKVLAQQGSKVILVDLNGQAAQKVSDDINNSYPDTAYSYEAGDPVHA
jgi:NAD(P)-dependent dehydrogenase (short-subunit alcohol dehydrogenase family)